MNNIIKIGVGVIILDNNKVLLGHRCNNYKDTGGIHENDSWCLPGGKQEYDETIQECIIRETKEETDLDISDIVIFSAEDDISSDRHFVTIHTYAKKYSGEVKVMEEEKIDEWKWFDINNLPSNLYSPSKKIIDNYLKRKEEK